MPPADFTLRFVKDARALQRFADALGNLSAFALDIETVDWWNRSRERVALIQIAYRRQEQVRVVIVDALVGFDLAPLRPPLERVSILKVIHNAAFDATRLEKHYGFRVAPVFDTMLAARRGKESRYSLQAQAEKHLNLRLDKSARASDWSRRPLDARQLHYAARDAYAALLLYENQAARGLRGASGSRAPADAAQSRLPLGAAPAPPDAPSEFSAAEILPPDETQAAPMRLTTEAAALLGVIAELPTRYSPAALAASVGAGRVGLTGWILDRRLGSESEPDEAAVKLAIADLCDNELIRLTETRRLEATEKGARLWRTIK